jgi:hypothetical protein
VWVLGCWVHDESFSKHKIHTTGGRLLVQSKPQDEMLLLHASDADTLATLALTAKQPQLRQQNDESEPCGN